MGEIRVSKMVARTKYKDRNGVEQVSQKYVEVTIETDDSYHYLSGGFALKDDFKAMKGAKWMGFDKENPRKVWRIANCARNNINIAFLEGKRPFSRYVTNIQEELKTQRINLRTQRTDYYGKTINIYDHQIEMTAFIMVRRQCIISGEMGVGKTLSVFEAMELSLVPIVWYVAPKSAITAVKLESMKWKLRCNTRFMTYDELKKVLAEWKAGDMPPQFVVFDESSKIKTPGSQRSLAAEYLANAMRATYGDKAYIVLMSGSPAPKSPLDWYNQCEIACPGFIKEGDMYKFQNRLAVMQRITDEIGYKYPKLLSWRDGNPNTCQCGLKKTDICHTETAHNDYHEFVQIDNEIQNLYGRMKGLTLVKLKKECLSLPDKIRRVIKIKPTMEMLRAAKMIAASARSAITALTLMRELSDGFQYKKKVEETEICEMCMGSCVLYNQDKTTRACELCVGTGTKNRESREIVEINSPKLDVVSDLMEECEDTQRLVLYAGFTASIDRLCAHVRKQDWHFIRIDGRGWANSINPNWTDLDCVKEFQNPNSEYKIVIVAHPASAGMGLTLTASSMFVYVSNDFNGEARIQSMDRGHRPGMDENRGCTIVDLILLPSDKKVIDNLDKKIELQGITMGDIAHAMDNFTYDDAMV